MLLDSLWVVVCKMYLFKMWPVLLCGLPLVAGLESVVLLMHTVNAAVATLKV